jgi:hypothetical protein
MKNFKQIYEDELADMNGDPLRAAQVLAAKMSADNPSEELEALRSLIREALVTRTMGKQYASSLKMPETYLLARGAR